MIMDSSAPGNGANASPQAGQHDCVGLKSCTAATTARAERSLRPWPLLPGCCPRFRGLAGLHCLVASLPLPVARSEMELTLGWVFCIGYVIPNFSGMRWCFMMGVLGSPKLYDRIAPLRSHTPQGLPRVLAPQAREELLAIGIERSYLPLIHLPLLEEGECHLTHKSATWAKICVTRAKWRRYASNANSMCLRRSSASSAPSLVLSSPTLPTLRHDLIDRRGEVVERASDSVQLLISLASCVLITTFLQLRQPFCGPLG